MCEHSMHEYIIIFMIISCIVGISFILTSNVVDFPTYFFYELYASDQLNITNTTSPSHVSSSALQNISDTNYSKNSYPPGGVLQIPYTGLIRNQITPEIAEGLGFNRSTYGMIVSEIVPDSPAEEAGFKAGNITRSISGEIIKLGGDVILKVDGNNKFIRNNDAYLYYLQNVKNVGDNITFSILRDGKIQELNLTIGSIPPFFWYENPDEGIEIAYPSDWETSEQGLKKDDIVRFFSPEQNPSNGLPIAGVFLKVFPAGEFGLDTLARQEREGSETIRNLNVTFTELGGLPAYESIFYNYEDQNRTQKMLSVFTIKDGKQVYRIIFGTDPWKFDDYLPLARKMVETFQFTSMQQ
jgi:hypothetical protein